MSDEPPFSSTREMGRAREQLDLAQPPRRWVFGTRQFFAFMRKEGAAW